MAIAQMRWTRGLANGLHAPMPSQVYRSVGRESKQASLDKTSSAPTPARPAGTIIVVPKTGEVLVCQRKMSPMRDRPRIPILSAAFSGQSIRQAWSPSGRMGKMNHAQYDIQTISLAFLHRTLEQKKKKGEKERKQTRIKKELVPKGPFFF